MELICGSIEVFLENPSLLYGYETEDKNFSHISLKRYGDKEAASHFYKLIIGEEAWTEEDEIWWDT